MRAVVLETYAVQYPDPIKVAAGAAVTVMRRDDRFTRWLWCRAADGREGWVPETILTATAPGPASVTEAYEATEVPVQEGTPVDILKEFDGRIGPAVVHCFTGTREECFECLDAGFFIGITGWLCDERRGQHLREFVKDIPADRLMVETDAPYLLPRTVRPQPSHRRNEPMYLAHIVEELARDRGETVETVAADTSAAATRFFRLPA